MGQEIERKNIRAVLFDFDYTLADTSKGVMESINFALDALHVSRVSYEAVCKTIGMPLQVAFHTLTGKAEEQKTDEFIKLFTKRADEVMAHMAVLYDTVPDVIRRLKEREFLLGIVSTKFHYRIEAILKRYGLFDAFNVIVGGEDVMQQKPDPAALQLALQTLGNIDPASAFYVGDSTIDAEAAKRAHMPFVAILSGTTQREDFNSYSPDAVCENLHQVADWVLSRD